MWSYDPDKAIVDAFGATLSGIVNDINSEQNEADVAAPITPLAAKLKDALNKHVKPLPGQVSGLVDRVQAVGERAGTAINNVNDAVAVAEGLVAEVEAAHQAVNEILEVVPDATQAAAPAPTASAGIPLPPAMAAQLQAQPALADAGMRGDHPVMAK